jgi:adenylate kinase family enzyme
MKTLFLIRGCPGAGKSFAANLLSENGKYPVLSADMYFEDDDGNYNWDPEKIKDAHAWCETMVAAWLKNGFNLSKLDPNIKHNLQKIFVANTFTQQWEMQPYFDLAMKYGYDVVTLVVENRHGGKNEHGVPDETIEKMKQRFQIKL